MSDTVTVVITYAVSYLVIVAYAINLHVRRRRATR